MGRSEIQEEVVYKKRDEYETLQEAISNELEDAKDVPTKKKYLVKKDYYKITLTQFDSFKNHLSSVESNVEKMNSLLNEISKAEKDLERNNREYDDAKHLLRKLNKCIEKLQISVYNQK